MQRIIHIQRHSINVVIDAVGELGFHNRYSYTGGNPVNRVDRNGMCWTNARASAEQQSQCFDAWSGYMDVINTTYTQDWPREVQIAVTQEARHWANLPYPQFVSEWNASTSFPEMSTNSLQSAGVTMIFQGAGISMLDSPLPGPADIPGWAWAGIGLCVVAIGAVATIGNGTIALPQRQIWDFSQDNTDENSDDDAIPIPWPVRPTREQQKIVLYRAIAPAELEFVRGTGFRSYGFSPSGGGKYFAITEIGVRAFTNSSINVGENAIEAITKVRISPEVAILGYYFVDVGEYGAGPSVHFSDANLAIMYADIIASNERIVII